MVPLRVWSMMSFHRSDISVAKELMPVLESTTGFVIVIVHVLTQYSNHWTRLMVKLLAQVKTIFHSISLQGCTQPNAIARHFFPCYFVFRINVIVCFCFFFLSFHSRVQRPRRNWLNPNYPIQCWARFGSWPITMPTVSL